MKVDNNVSIRANALRSTRPTGGGAGKFATELTSDSRSPGVSGGAPIGGAAALMALQEVADHGEGRRKAVARGKELLDLLDELRLGLLTGGISRAALTDLAGAAGKARARVESPALQSVLDEIDLRVQVELAKLERAA